MSEEEVKPNAKGAPTQDAQLAAESIAKGEEKAPTVDLDADYENAQKLSVSDVDRTGTGAKAAEAATANKQKVSEQKETATEAQPTSDPNDYLDMAKDIGRSQD